MLTKVNRYNYQLGTGPLEKIFKQNNEITQAQDNLNGQILISNGKKTWMYIASTESQSIWDSTRKFLHKTIQIEVQGYKFIKSLESFDQNNLLIANKIRSYVIKLTKSNSWNTTLGIGGEFYIYFHFVQSKKFIGISNHQSIINDANINSPYSTNKLVDYSKLNLDTNPDLIILNLSNIHIKVIEWIKSHSLNLKKLIIITCELSDSKLKLLTKNFYIRSIKHFSNIKSWVWIIEILV